MTTSVPPRARAAEYSSRFGSVEDMHDLDQLCIKRWAEHIDRSVIGAGCGPGHRNDSLYRHGVEVQGIDLVLVFIDRAQERFPGVPFRVASEETKAATSRDHVLRQMQQTTPPSERVPSAPAQHDSKRKPRLPALLNFHERISKGRTPEGEGTAMVRRLLDRCVPVPRRR